MNRLRTFLLLATVLLSGPAAAQTCGKVSACQPATLPLTGAETIYVVQGGQSRKATVADALSGSGGTLVSPTISGNGLINLAYQNTFAPGVRAPLFIWQNPSGTNPAGQNAACQFWVGNNPTATPAATDTVVCTFAIDNLNGRQAIWALNVVLNQYTVAQGGSFQIARAIELDNAAGIGATVPTSAYSSGAVLHGIENVSSNNTSGTVAPPHVAFWIFADGDKSATQPWWQFGYSCARVNLACLDIEDISGDTGSSFTEASIWDKSKSGNVIFDQGTHGQGINLGGSYSNLAIVSPGFSVDGAGNVSLAGLTAASLPSSGGTTYACFNSSHQLVSQTAAC